MKIALLILLSISLYFLYSQDSISICGSQQFDYDVSRCGSCSLCGWLNFLDVLFIVFNQVWEIVSHDFFKNPHAHFSLFSPSGTLIMNILVYLIVSLTSL